MTITWKVQAPEAPKPKTIWVLTRSFNDYDQHGQYFVAAWTTKPTKEQLQPLTGFNEKGLDHLLINGGGRIGVEYDWYDLTEWNEGENGF